MSIAHFATYFLVAGCRPTTDARVVNLLFYRVLQKLDIENSVRPLYEVKWNSVLPVRHDDPIHRVERCQAASITQSFYRGSNTILRDYFICRFAKSSLTAIAAARWLEPCVCLS
jgi:hypothetical protein